MGESSCSAEEYVAGEDALPVCADFDCEEWGENWLNSLNDNPNSDTEEVDYDLLPPPSKLTCFSKLLKPWKMYKYSWNTEAMFTVEQATSVGKVMINLAGISVDNYTQTTIDQYFS